MATKQKKFRAAENKPLAQSAAERAFSGSWGTHADKRTKRARTRSLQKNRAISDYR